MPKIFDKDGFRFFFYSNEHRPIHVHVRHGDGEAVFDVEEGIELRESQNMKISELSKAQQLAEENRPFRHFLVIFHYVKAALEREEVHRCRRHCREQFV